MRTLGDETLESERNALIDRASGLIERLSAGGRDDQARDALLADISRFQAATIPAYARIVAVRGEGAAVPTDVFRFARIAAHSPELDVRVFKTSGTTSGRQGEHALRTLDLYDRAAHAAARHMLFPDKERMRLVILAADEREAPHSSLSYMLARFCSWFCEADPAYAWKDGTLDIDALGGALDSAERAGQPVALLGTSFAFVFAEDALEERGKTYRLPAGSRAMQTGGFKGRTREIKKSEMIASIAHRYGLGTDWVTSEYGMTELSSQMYEHGLRRAAMGTPGEDAHLLWFPGWMDAYAVDPATLTRLPEGEVGVLRIGDCANVDSACWIQTADLARVTKAGVELLGRATGAALRGCSLSVEEALSRS